MREKVKYEMFSKFCLAVRMKSNEVMLLYLMERAVDFKSGNQRLTTSLSVGSCISEIKMDRGHSVSYDVSEQRRSYADSISLDDLRMRNDMFARLRKTTTQQISKSLKSISSIHLN